ncbi:MAG TPA: 3-isopropylmalate dehydratase small subunit [Candidatus Dormibacteraeota bacterium]
MKHSEPVVGRAAPLWRADVDTDQIIPKQFLKRIERTGYGEFLFYDWRRADPGFVLDRPEHRGAKILVAGPNFGCGSSREHAVWAIQQAGFDAVIAPFFADIFRSNCRQSGLLAVTLPEAEVKALAELLAVQPEAEVTVDLEAQVVTWPGREIEFDIDPFTRECLLNGWDDVGLVLRQADAIAAYERRRSELLPQAL